MKMKQIQEAVFIFVALSTLSVIANAQDEYANCSSNYTVLENALLGTSDNLFRMSTTFFNPEYINPVYVDVFYHFGDTNTSARYKWSASSLYLIVPPSALQHLSLFFSYFEKGSTAKLNLQLPVDCIELKNVTDFTKQNFLFVLTQRVSIGTHNTIQTKGGGKGGGRGGNSFPNVRRRGALFPQNHRQVMYLRTCSYTVFVHAAQQHIIKWPPLMVDATNASITNRNHGVIAYIHASVTQSYKHVKTCGFSLLPK